MNRNLPTLTPEITEAFAPAVLEVIRNSIAPTANDQEFLLFAHKAASYGLDPFKNEIFFIKYGNQARIQFAAEAYLSKAREQEGFIPPDTQMVHENDEFKIAMNKETKQMEVVQHEIGFPRGKIIGAYSVAYREGYPPVTVIMDIDEVAHMFTGQNKDNWNKWTSDMFGKHVQQRALKKQYGLSFEDLTITPNDAPQPVKQVRKDITPNQEQLEPPVEQPVLTRADELRKEINARLKQLGITTKKAVQEYLDKNAPNIDPATATEAEMVGLIGLLDLNIEMLDSQPHNDDDLLE
ncbi:recombinase RecT [Lysinibacillus boronitolerans]|uniref:RecT family recombinase n=1 Tax=Lysinibacillus boronitolerans TaxID=309788 RepID=UPI0021639F55|nr:RecT family recombinase [Lysinibacillus boronitolerans]MCS1392997.1 recombinase RecT [Lysinibacillus boronitolerans]